MLRTFNSLKIGQEFELQCSRSKCEVLLEAEMEKTDQTQSGFLRSRHFRQLIPTVTRNQVTKDKSVKNNEVKLRPP